MLEKFYRENIKFDTQHFLKGQIILVYKINIISYQIYLRNL